jgi:hypothetical protein
VFRKQVRCIDCGFLGCRSSGETRDVDLECPLKWRTVIIAKGALRQPNDLNCTRGIWHRSELLNRNISDWPKVIGDFVNKVRKCSYFFPYHPGYLPSEHRELQREAQTRRLLTRNMLLAATIGAGAAILAQHLAR